MAGAICRRRYSKGLIALLHIALLVCSSFYMLRKLPPVISQSLLISDLQSLRKDFDACETSKPVFSSRSPSSNQIVYFSRQLLLLAPVTGTLTRGSHGDHDGRHEAGMPLRWVPLGFSRRHFVFDGLPTWPSPSLAFSGAQRGFRVAGMTPTDCMLRRNNAVHAGRLEFCFVHRCTCLAGSASSRVRSGVPFPTAASARILLSCRHLPSPICVCVACASVKSQKQTHCVQLSNAISSDDTV